METLSNYLWAYKFWGLRVFNPFRLIGNLEILSTRKASQHCGHNYFLCQLVTFVYLHYRMNSLTSWNALDFKMLLWWVLNDSTIGAAFIVLGNLWYYPSGVVVSCCSFYTVPWSNAQHLAKSEDMNIGIYMCISFLHT